MFIVKFKRAAAVTHGGKYETDFVNIPHIKDSCRHAFHPQICRQGER